eukprot:scaffold7444_cov350-Prasinococcus_capsulatus_cf.AAC.3
MGMGKEGKPPSAAPAEKVVEANGEAGAGNHRKQVSFSDEGPAANDVKIDLKLDDDSKSTNGSSNGSVRSRQLSGKRSFDEMRSASMKRLGTLSEQFTVKFDLSCSVTVTLPSNFMADAYNRCASPAGVKEVVSCTSADASFPLSVICRVVKKTQPGPKVFDKQVLQNVKGTALPGEFLVLLGPSGSGKTTLIQLLCGRVGPKYHTEGSLTYNDRALTKSIRRKVGFVMQDDVLYQALTVWETLFYAAVLRMPSSVPIADKKKRVSELISLLGLERCAQSTIGGGNAFRGISGGERRRVSIGVELVIDPAVLFLDEVRRDTECCWRC